MFEPQLFTNMPPSPQPATYDPAMMSQPEPMQIQPEMVQAPAPVIQPPVEVPVPVPVFVPQPMQVKKPKGLKISADVARKAQGIYPKEAAEKQQMINNAKMPTPTGAWGAPA